MRGQNSIIVKYMKTVVKHFVVRDYGKPYVDDKGLIANAELALGNRLPAEEYHDDYVNAAWYVGREHERQLK